MTKYKVKIKGGDKEETINAKSELEAKVKFCQEKDLEYRVFFNKLDAKKINDKK